jgi:hypothetical protein
MEAAHSICEPAHGSLPLQKGQHVSIGRPYP